MDDEIEFHEDGDEVPWWFIALYLAMLIIGSASMLGLVVNM